MQVRRVLVAVGLNRSAPKTALAAAEIAALCGAELTVLTVLADPWELVAPDEVEGLRRTRQSSPAAVAVERAAAQLKELTGPATLSAPCVTRRVTFGMPSVEIARGAEEIAADLIVMGRGDLSRPDGESVTAATLRRSRVPVFVTPLQHRAYRHLLTCVDDTPNAVDVLETAMAMGEHLGATVMALHVEPAGNGPMTSGGRKPSRGATAVAECETIVRRGDIATEILSLVRLRDTDLIVFGYRRGLNYGDVGAAATVAARLLRHAECALLAVPV